MAMSGFGLALCGVLACSVAISAHQCKRADELAVQGRMKDEVIAQLRMEPEWLDTILTRYAGEATRIADIRRAVRQEVAKSLRNDPDFRAWASGALPGGLRDPGVMLGKTGPGDHPADPAAVPDHRTGVPDLERIDQR